MNARDLSALERDLNLSYPTSFHLALANFIELCEAASFAASFPKTHLLLTASEVQVARRESESRLLPFMLSEDNFPDIYAFDLSSQGPEYTVVVWAVHTAVHQWSGFTEFLAWVQEQCSV